MRARVVAVSLLLAMSLCASAVAEMKCPKCADKYPDEASFCPKDGTKLVKAAASARTVEARFDAYGLNGKLPVSFHVRVVDRPDRDEREIIMQQREGGATPTETIVLVEDFKGKPLRFSYAKAADGGKKVTGTIRGKKLEITSEEQGRKTTETREWEQGAVFHHGPLGDPQWTACLAGGGETVRYRTYHPDDGIFMDATAAPAGTATNTILGRDMNVRVVRVEFRGGKTVTFDALFSPDGPIVALEMGGGAVRLVQVPAAGAATRKQAASEAANGKHVNLRNDMLELKADLALLPDGSFPVAFTCLMGREISPEKMAAYAVMNLPAAEREAALKKMLGEGRQGQQGGTTMPFATMTLRNLTDGTLDLRAALQVARYSDPAATTVQLAKGEARTIRLSPAFSDTIMALTEERMTNVSVRVERTGGGVVVERTLPLKLLSRNDMVWSVEESFDLQWLIAVFVTPRPSNKAIDTLLREAAELTLFKSIVGYQDTSATERKRSGALWREVTRDLSRRETVEAQAKALFNAIKARGVRYVNAPVSFGRGAQRVKYADEVLADRSGNCIETTVLFASAFEAMGMHPVVVIVPGHAFVGVQRWEWGSGRDAVGDPIVIETTMVGSDSYEAARRVAEARYEEAKKKGKLRLIMISMLRYLGIAPAAR